MVCSSAVSQECSASVSDAKGSFNIEMVISDILADPNCASLALPCLLTAEQRKQVKAAVAQHPNLKCESFGMGKDRQMHVFKCKENSTSESRISDRSPVNVKNTFIDDWIDADVARADNRIVQSMPHNMFGMCLSEELARAANDSVEASDSDRNDGISSPSPEAKENQSDLLLSPARWVEEPLVEEQMFDLGTSVVIDGLVKAPSFNGAVGVVQSWDAATGRYNVYLSTPTTTGHRWAKLKAENLQLSR